MGKVLIKLLMMDLMQQFFALKVLLLRDYSKKLENSYNHQDNYLKMNTN